MEPILDSFEKKFAGKIYKERGIWLATFLGGPLAAGYMMAENFKVFGESDKARTAWSYAILVMAAILGIIFFMPGADRIPNIVFPVVYAGVTNALVQNYQRKNISNHFSAGGEFFSNWRALGIGLLIGVLFGLLFVGGAFFFTGTAGRY